MGAEADLEKFVYLIYFLENDRSTTIGVLP